MNIAALQKRSLSLRNALESGVLNINELRSFMKDFENATTDNSKPKKHTTSSFGKYMLKLETPLKRKRA